MSTGEFVQIGVLVVLFVMGMVGFQRFRDAGAASIPDERPPTPKKPTEREDGAPADQDGYGDDARRD
jgi:hypothetical protein